jgi:2-iminobutanoate/2-iminopropanoate deaminase
MADRITLKPYDSYDLTTFVIHGDTVHIGHFGGIYNDAGKVLRSIEGQTLQTFQNLEKALGEINLTLDDVLKVTVILKNLDDFGGMHQIWRRVFRSGYPVRTTITSEFIDDQCLIQIEGTAGLEI